MVKEPDYRAMAAAMIPELTAAFPAKLQAFVIALEKDSASYKFECKRHGDFLAVFLTRGDHKITSAINLATVRTIHVTPGNAPDMKGRVTFSRSASTNGPVVVAHYGDRGWHQTGYLIHVDPPPSNERSGMMMYGSTWYDDELSGIHLDGPRPASDDTIRFEHGVTLFMPFGCGQAVYDAILAECTRYVSALPSTGAVNE